MKNAYPYLPATGVVRRTISFIAAAIIVLTSLQSCEKQDTAVSGSLQQTVSADAVVSDAVTKEQALARLNEHFKNEFSPITMEQVVGVSRIQFLKWLRNSKMAPAEDLYLKPVFQSDSIEYLILKNVTVKQTGKLASVGLIAVTPKLFPQFTRMVAVINYNNIFIGNKHICSWKRCDSYSPCPCITWIDFVYGDCPSDKCMDNYDCRGYSSGD